MSDFIWQLRFALYGTWQARGSGLGFRFWWDIGGESLPHSKPDGYTPAEAFHEEASAMMR